MISNKVQNDLFKNCEIKNNLFKDSDISFAFSKKNKLDSNIRTLENDLTITESLNLNKNSIIPDIESAFSVNENFKTIISTSTIYNQVSNYIDYGKKEEIKIEKINAFTKTNKMTPKRLNKIKIVIQENEFLNSCNLKFRKMLSHQGLFSRYTKFDRMQK